MPSDRHRNCVADKIVGTISGLSRGRWRAASYSPIRSVTKLISNVEIKLFAFESGSDAEEVPVFVRDHRQIMSVWHRVFIENIACTYMPAVVKIAGYTKFVIPA